MGLVHDMEELLEMGRGSRNCIDDFVAFIRMANGLSPYDLQFFWYVGKASRPVRNNGPIIGDKVTSRQVKSFKEHLPVNHDFFDGRVGARAMVIDEVGTLRSAVSYYYNGKSEMSVDVLLKEFTAKVFPNTHEGLRLNMIETNGERDENCYVHIYAVSNMRARSVAHP